MVGSFSLNPRLVFKEALDVEASIVGLCLTEWAVYYLVDLLAYKAHSLPLDEPLVFQIDAASSMVSNKERMTAYRTAGDCCVMRLSFFRDSLEHGGISEDYVATLGVSSYIHASALAGNVDGFQDSYRELASNFRSITGLLRGVSRHLVLG